MFLSQSDGDDINVTITWFYFSAKLIVQFTNFCSPLYFTVAVV